MEKSFVLSVDLSNGERFEYHYGSTSFGDLLERDLKITGGTLGFHPLHPDTEAVAMYIRIGTDGDKQQFHIITSEKRGDKAHLTHFRANGQHMREEVVDLPESYWDFALPVERSV